MNGANCVFCKIASGDIPSQKVWESPDYLAFRDLNPQAPSHMLLIPKRHLASLAEAGEADAPMLGGLQVAAATVAREQGLDSFRLVTNSGADAGQSVLHLHYHLLAGRRMAWPPG